MSIPYPANDTALKQRLAALEIDLQSALIISNALLRGLKATSSPMHHAVDLALGEALQAIATEDGHESAAVHAIVSETRVRLRSETGLQDRVAHDIERLIVEKASTIQGDDGVIVDLGLSRRNRRRPSAKPT